MIDLGVAAIVGIEIIEEADEAAKPYRQRVHVDYHAAGPAELPPEVRHLRKGWVSEA